MLGLPVAHGNFSDDLWEILSALEYGMSLSEKIFSLDGDGIRLRALKARACMYTVTPDRRFVIDALDGLPNVLIASACSGHGFKHSAGLGEAIAERVLGRASSHGLDLRPFARQRLLEKKTA